jgi:uncharacterized membrane protein YphA (DoxX/SURF4 family)
MENLMNPDMNWSYPKKIAFRFCFLYFSIYILFTPNNEIPLINLLYEQVDNLLHRFIPWFARTFFGYHKEIIIAPSGSGDTTYYYLLWFFNIVLTVIGTLIWAFFDRKRKNYNTLYYWISVIVRYYLFYTMIIYGLYKVIKLQFPFPSLMRLVEPYGDSSPMGLAWTYMGYSESYNYFTGFAELLGGILLLSRRTTTFGALVCLGVMSNVFMINMGYDVPVKLLSFNTILMSLFLLWKDTKRLVYFFLLNRPVPATDISLPYSNKKFRYALIGLKFLFIISITGITLMQALDAQKEYGQKAPKPPLYGIYYTESFVKNNEPIPPLATDTTRWKRIIIASRRFASIQLMNDSIRMYNLKIDTVTKTALINPVGDTLSKTTFSYTTDTPYLTFTGLVKNDSTFIRLKRFDENKFLLMNRGFHWVNEFPYNR